LLRLLDGAPSLWNYRYCPEEFEELAVAVPAPFGMLK
jgi:hypothetical protein